MYPCSLALNLHLPNEVLTEKLLGRKECAVCKKGYNIADINDGMYVMPPLLPQHDAECQGCKNHNWISREDDNEVVIKNRLNEFDKQTTPLVN